MSGSLAIGLVCVLHGGGGRKRERERKRPCMEGLEIIQASAAVAKGENVKLFLGHISFSSSSEENMQ